MSGTILLKRGSTKACNAYTGKAGELVIDTDTNTIRTQDGSTAGGHTVAMEAYVQRFVLQTLGQTNFYRRPSLFTSNKTSVTIPKNTQVAINGEVYISNEDTTISTSMVATAVDLAGKDVYIYAVPGTVSDSSYYNNCNFILSTNSTVPTGYTAETSRKIGGFHCLCMSVGTINGHNLSGYVTGDIIPYSCWDLLHRPICEPEGMVYVDTIGKWVQIYLPSWNGSKLVSRYGGTICDGGSSKMMGGEEFAYYAGISGCRLAKRDEFVVFARGSNEQTNINGASDPGTTGGHYNTANRRMISNYGIEDCCNVIWQWGADMFENYPESTWNSSNFALSGYSWQTSSIAKVESGMGCCFGLLRRVLMGGGWNAGALGGTRSASCLVFSGNSGSDCSARLCSEPQTPEV